MWQTIFENGNCHVMPLNDVYSHFETVYCDCEPRVLMEGECMIVIHNSFDGREVVEWINEYLKE